MIDQFKAELIEYGTSQLPKFKPKDLNLYKEPQITKLLDKYGDKWMALNKAIWAKRQEILSRPEAIPVDGIIVESEFNRAMVTIRNKFTAAYPVNL